MASSSNSQQLMEYVSRAEAKLEHALNNFNVVDFITIDTSWTKLSKVVPNALKNLKDEGWIITLVKPHYEAELKMLRKGKLLEDFIPEVLNAVREDLKELGVEILAETESPIVGEKGKNKEYLLYLAPKH